MVQKVKPISVRASCKFGGQTAFNEDIVVALQQLLPFRADPASLPTEPHGPPPVSRTRHPWPVWPVMTKRRRPFQAVQRIGRVRARQGPLVPAGRGRHIAALSGRRGRAKGRARFHSSNSHPRTPGGARTFHSAARTNRFPGRTPVRNKILADAVSPIGFEFRVQIDAGGGGGHLGDQLRAPTM